MKKRKIRRLGDILTDQERLFDEYFHDHDMEWGNVMAMLFQFIRDHYPNHRETYLDGTHPDYIFPSEKK